MPACAASDPEAHLAELPGDGALVAFLEVAGDDRAEDRLEAGLELLRQARHLLRRPIDPDRRRRSEQAEDRDVQPRVPHSTTSAMASGRYSREPCRIRAGLGRQPCGKP
jgi:hypothetical protein